MQQPNNGPMQYLLQAIDLRRALVQLEQQLAMMQERKPRSLERILKEVT